jgi:hypothetical protein
VSSLQGAKHDFLDITFHGVLVHRHGTQDLIASVLLFSVCSVLLGSRDVFGGSG